MKKQELKEQRKSLKECFKQLAYNTELSKDEKQELEEHGIKDNSYNMYIAFKTMQRAINGDNKALKVYLEQTGQDKEIEFKEREITIKEKLFSKEWANVINDTENRGKDTNCFSVHYEPYEYITDAETEYNELVKERT